MNRKEDNEKGFSAVEVVLVAAIVILVGIVGYMIYKEHNKTNGKNETETANSTSNLNTTKTPATQKSETANVIVVKTTDNHAQFSLPNSWKVSDRVDGGQYCGFATAESAQGTCLLDVSFQPTTFDSGGRTFWDAKVFQTTKSPKTWNTDVNGTGPGSCDNPIQKTLGNYQELICKDSGGGTEYIVSNGQYLAYFGNVGSSQYATDFDSIVNSVTFQ